MKIASIFCFIAFLSLACGCASTKKVQELIDNNNSEYVDQQILQNNVEYVDQQLQPVISALNDQKETVQDIRSTLDVYGGMKEEIEILRRLLIQSMDEIKPIIVQLENDVQDVQNTKNSHAKRIDKAERVLENQKSSLLQFFNNELKELESLIKVLGEQMEEDDPGQLIEEHKGAGATLNP